MKKLTKTISTIIFIIFILGTMSYGFGGGQASQPENEISEETETRNINGFIYQYNNTKNKDEYLQNYLKENKIDTVKKIENFKDDLDSEVKKRESDNKTSISSPEEKNKRVEQAKEAYQAVDNYYKEYKTFNEIQSSEGRYRNNRNRFGR